MSLVPNLKPRYVAGRRVHHGLVGIALVALGAVLVADDWSDRWWAPERRP